jgi:hypothetical protein
MAAVSDEALRAKEIEAKRLANLEQNQLTLDEQTGKDRGKGRDIDDRGKALAANLSKIDAETERAIVAARIAAPGMLTAEQGGARRTGFEKGILGLSMAGTDKQIAAVEGELLTLKKEMDALDLEALKDKDPKIFEEALGRQQKLKDAIPDLQKTLDSLQVARLKLQFEGINLDMQRTVAPIAARISRAPGVTTGLGAGISTSLTGGGMLAGTGAGLASFLNSGPRPAGVSIGSSMDRSTTLARETATNTKEANKHLQRIAEAVERKGTPAESATWAG